MKVRFLTAAVALCVYATLGLMQTAAAQSAVVYFSRAENTDIQRARLDGLSAASLTADNIPATGFVAHRIAQTLDIPVFSLHAKSAYPSDFDETVKRNHEESANPLLTVPDLSEFDEIFLGHPIWNMSIPKPVEDFLKRASLANKRIYVFNTHDGYGTGRSLNQIKAALSQSVVSEDVLSIHAIELTNISSRLTQWLADKAPRNKKASAAEVNMIYAHAGHETIQVQLNHSSEAKAFARLLPVTVHMGEYGGREYYGPLNQTIETTSEGQYTFENGTLTWCPTNDTVAIFYAQSARPRLSMAVYPMGKVIGDLSVFERLLDSASFTFTKEAP